MLHNPPFSTGINRPLSPASRRSGARPARAGTAGGGEATVRPAETVGTPPDTVAEPAGVPAGAQAAAGGPGTVVPACPDGFLHTVQPGETLSGIARRFGVTVDAVLAANPQIEDSDLILPDRLICVPFAPPPACAGGTLHTAEPGETLFAIAQRFGVTLDALTAANQQITDPNLVFPGQQVCVPRS